LDRGGIKELYLFYYVAETDVTGMIF